MLHIKNHFNLFNYAFSVKKMASTKKRLLKHCYLIPLRTPIELNFLQIQQKGEKRNFLLLRIF